jgi:hypothetical protein
MDGIQGRLGTESWSLVSPKASKDSAAYYISILAIFDVAMVASPTPTSTSASPSMSGLRHGTTAVDPRPPQVSPRTGPDEWFH